MKSLFFIISFFSAISVKADIADYKVSCESNYLYDLDMKSNSDESAIKKLIATNSAAGFPTVISVSTRPAESIGERNLIVYCVTSKK